MFYRLAPDADAGSECVNKIDTPAPQFAGHRVLGVLRDVKCDPNLARSHQVGDPRVSGLLRIRHVAPPMGALRR
jgi:hypothetical protein